MSGKLTTRQRRYIRKQTKVRELDPSEMAGELNVIPFLDIVVNIIMFLLATTAALAIFAQVEAKLPTYSRGVGGRGAQEPKLNLNVTVTAEGLIVTGSGGKLAPGCETTGSGKVITVPLRAGTTYDWAALTECVDKVKTKWPEEREVIISADPLVAFEHLIAAMDAVRSKGATELFPKVMLSAGVR